MAGRWSKARRKQNMRTTELTRRSLLISGLVAGVGVLASCRSTAPAPQSSSSVTPRSEPVVPSPSEPADQAARPQGDLYGVGVYNTQEVADELVYIDGNVRPFDGVPKRVLITGSTAGAGQLAAAYLVKRGHTVVAHARDAQRAADVRRDLPRLHEVVIGDLRHLDETRALAQQINALGKFDVIIHNAAEYRISGPEILSANSLSPYLLTALVTPPQQLSYLSSDQHFGGGLKLDEIRSGGGIGYPDSKLHMAMIAMAVARLRPESQANAVNPGWIPTWLAFQDGPYSEDDLRAGYMTQVWLAEGVEPGSDITGEYLFHQGMDTRVSDLVHDEDAQDHLLAAYAEQTGVTLS
ncbi:SDR family NAD(P)-dependent oxidoreductase [Agromyces sp. ISL-38]|uniref:SDR family NAD(P)-dependent oxidoreductase n=1 Tax=Agromyces sp. ISL-38 TaxID=2819107 RepID=UPI001BE899A5|nr:SDR family NAD(P)-dependent oxidoreductase [Agromyces sp. ISL-38]MBT2498564.1 SDR family NAD(P)-dependent oxidoreductase [Agromyces sp. ISL-38]